MMNISKNNYFQFFHLFLKEKFGEEDSGNYLKWLQTMHHFKRDRKSMIRNSTRNKALWIKIKN